MLTVRSGAGHLFETIADLRKTPVGALDLRAVLICTTHPVWRARFESVTDLHNTPRLARGAPSTPLIEGAGSLYLRFSSLALTISAI